MSENTEQTPQEPSAIEQEAMENGWRPKEEFEANEENKGKKWRTAEEFMDRKPLFDKIDEQHRRLRDLEKGLNALAEHNKKIEASAYERALRELRNERKVALEEGDLVKAEEIRDRIDEVKEAQKQEVKPQPVQNDYAAAWVQKNEWYLKDPDMKAYADGLATQLLNEGIRDPAEALPKIERKVREMFASKFRNPNKERAPAVESAGGKQKADTFKLTSKEEEMMNFMLKAGAPISREDYIKQIKASRGE